MPLYSLYRQLISILFRLPLLAPTNCSAPPCQTAELSGRRRILKDYARVSTHCFHTSFASNPPSYFPFFHPLLLSLSPLSSRPLIPSVEDSWCVLTISATRPTGIRPSPSVDGGLYIFLISIIQLIFNLRIM